MRRRTYERGMEKLSRNEMTFEQADIFALGLTLETGNTDWLYSAVKINGRVTLQRRRGNVAAIIGTSNTSQ